MAKWSDEEINWLISNYPLLGKLECSKRLFRSESSIRKKACNLGLKQDRNSEFFSQWQSRAAKSKIGKKRPEQALVIKRLHEAGKLLKSDSQKKQMSARVNDWVAKNGHPKGMKGKTHSNETKKTISVKSIQAWKDPEFICNTDEYRKSLSDRMHNSFVNGKRNSINNYSRAKSGRRDDLDGLFVRSSWEANYARYLNFLVKNGKIVRWEYEPDMFVFEQIKRGTRSYKPDFKIWETSESAPYYVELKGWMDAKSKTKLSRMAKYYPSIRIELIQKKQYEEIRRKVSHLIPFWE